MVKDWETIQLKKRRHIQLGQAFNLAAQSFIQKNLEWDEIKPRAKKYLAMLKELEEEEFGK